MIKKTIYLGKIDYSGNGKKTNRVTIEAELKQIKNLSFTTDTEPIKEYYTFSASANIWQGNNRDIDAGGQMVDEAASYFPENEIAQRLKEIWEKYHLNDLNAGTEKQSNCLDEYKKVNPEWRYEYTAACTILEEVDLLEDSGYKYGSKWLVRPIPETIVEEIKELLK